MGGGPDQGGGAVSGEADLAGHLRPGGGRGHEGCEGQEGLRQKTVIRSRWMILQKVWDCWTRCGWQFGKLCVDVVWKTCTNAALHKLLCSHCTDCNIV
jgi:hypothetical protein